jgi:hypothetical protein
VRAGQQVHVGRGLAVLDFGGREDVLARIVVGEQADQAVCFNCSFLDAVRAEATHTGRPRALMASIAWRTCGTASSSSMSGVAPHEPFGQEIPRQRLAQPGLDIAARRAPRARGTTSSIPRA